MCVVHGLLAVSHRSAVVGCQYEQVEANNRDLLSLLKDVTHTAYFRYFKVNLFCDCPHWPDDSMCALEACSVCECDESEVPAAWKEAEAEGCQSLCAYPGAFGIPRSAACSVQICPLALA